MDQPYSLWADWLSKFHIWPVFIQALWLITVPGMVLGMTWLVLRALRDLAPPLSRRRGILISGIYQDPRGLWMIYQLGRPPKEVDWTNPPPELIGRGRVIRGVFRGREE